MSARKACVASAVALALLAVPASAQPEASRTAVSFFGGASSANSTTGVALGGAMLFDLHERAAIEGQGTYLDRGRGADAFTAGGSLLVNLVSSREALVPYAAIGGGVYHASFDLGNARFLGPLGAPIAPGTQVCPAPGTGVGPGPGAGFGPGTGTCPATTPGYWGVGQMGAFYARRLGVLTVPGNGIWGSRSFTDPMVSFGGGLRFNVSQRLMIRPEARALVLFGDGDTQTVGLFGVHVAFRF